MRKIVTFSLLLFFLWLPVRTTRAATPPAGSVVISEVYGGGGNVEATYANDYVELFNRTRNAIDLTGWTVGYSSKASTTWSATTLKGSIAAYHYYLVRLGSGGGTGSKLLPAPDATGSSNLARTAGKVRVANPAGVSDLVGYGTDVNAAEGKPAAAPTDNAHSVTRIDAGCTDTNANDRDFRVRTPGPRNKASDGYACGTAPVLAPIGSKKVQANRALSFVVTATDAEKDPLAYSASPLPAGARFTPSTRTFEWQPSQEQVGDHRVTFKVSDGYRSDSETVTITVTPDPYVGRSEITLNVTSDVRRLYANGVVRPSHPGGTVTAKLFRYEQGSYRRYEVVRTTLDANSAYRATFRRPASGRCIVNATFAGDADHPPASAEVQVRC